LGLSDKECNSKGVSLDFAFKDAFAFKAFEFKDVFSFGPQACKNV
jgi:hypothetical protein